MLKKPWLLSGIGFVLLCAVAIGTISYTNSIHKTSSAHGVCDINSPGCNVCIIHNGQKSPVCGPESKIG